MGQMRLEGTRPCTLNPKSEMYVDSIVSFATGSLSARAVEHLACTGGASPRSEGGGRGRRRAGAVKGVGAAGVCAVRRRRRWLSCKHLCARAHSVSLTTGSLSARAVEHLACTGGASPRSEGRGRRRGAAMGRLREAAGRQPGGTAD